METILAGVAMFCAIVVVLVALILIARKFLVQSGDIKIGVNGDPDKTLTCPAGGKLLNDLSEKGIFVSSACGGRGACGQCKVKVTEGGGNVLPIEYSHFTKKEIKEGWRLACQVTVKNDCQIELPASVFGVKKWECEVILTTTLLPSLKSYVCVFQRARKFHSALVVIFRLRLLHILLSTQISISNHSTWAHSSTLVLIS